MLKYIRAFFILCSFLIIIGGLQLITHNPFSRQIKNELNIFAYSDFFDINMIHDFEEKTGIKINLHYYSTNEELLAKLKLTENEHYDLLVLADYASNILAQQGKLLPIDKSRIDFFDTLYPFLLNKEFDKGNKYSVPYMWECTGIAYNTKVLTPKEVSFEIFFNSPYEKVSINDPIETINLASHFLFGDKESLSSEEEEEIISTLKRQKSTIEAYAEFRAKDLIAGENVPVALIKTPFVSNLEKENDSITFSFPKEAIFTSIESIVLLKKAQNIDNAYLFLNYLYKPENLAKTVAQFPCFPASKDALSYIDLNDNFLKLIDEVERREKDMRFFHYIIDKEKAHKIYIETKS